MKKIFMWVVSNDGRFLNAAINILGRQHNGVEIAGVTANEKILLDVDGIKVSYVPLDRLTGGGR